MDIEKEVKRLNREMFEIKNGIDVLSFVIKEMAANPSPKKLDALKEIIDKVQSRVK